MKSLLRAVLVIIVLVGAGYSLAKHLEGQEQREVAWTEFDELVVALREKSNRLEVYRLSGTVTTNSSVSGGWGNILQGRMTAKQPWSVSYFADLRELTLEDYIWDATTRTLIVRMPATTPDAPNIDETKQVVSFKGPILTRGMQTQLRQAVASGAQKQAAAEAAKPDNMMTAARAARSAISRNIEAPLKAAGLSGITIVVRAPVDGTNIPAERWDVSRSIAEVLTERAAR